MPSEPTPAQRARRSTLRPDGTPVRVTRRRAETRARLLEAAFGVFAARGFGRASIEDVCEAAGFTRGAFYSNFDSLDELFFALYTQRNEAIAGQVTAGLNDPPTDLRALLARAVHVLVVDRKWVLLRTEFLLYAARTPEVAPKFAAHRDRLRDALAASLAPAIDCSALPLSLQSPAGLAQAVMAVHDGAATQLLLDDDPAQFRSWLADLLTALLDHTGSVAVAGRPASGT